MASHQLPLAYQQIQKFIFWGTKMASLESLAFTGKQN